MAQRGWVAARAGHRAIFLVAFDDGWVESQRQVPLLRQPRVGKPLLMLLIVIGGLALEMAISRWARTIGIHYPIVVLASLVILVVTIGVPLTWALVQRVRRLTGKDSVRWLDPDLAPESMLTSRPPRRVRRAATAVELRPVVGLTRVHALAEVESVSIDQEGVDQLVTVIERDGGRRTYRFDRQAQRSSSFGACSRFSTARSILP